MRIHELVTWLLSSVRILISRLLVLSCSLPYTHTPYFFTDLILSLTVSLTIRCLCLLCTDPWPLTLSLATKQCSLRFPLFLFFAFSFCNSLLCFVCIPLHWISARHFCYYCFNFRWRLKFLYTDAWLFFLVLLLSERKRLSWL